MARKVFVEVTAKFDTEGRIIPLSLLWEDGTVYEINRVLDVRRAASLKAGGMGIRYTVSKAADKAICILKNQNGLWKQKDDADNS